MEGRNVVADANFAAFGGAQEPIDRAALLVGQVFEAQEDGLQTVAIGAGQVAGRLGGDEDLAERAGKG